MVDGLAEVQAIHPPNHLVHRPEAERRHVLADFLRDEAEEVHDVFGLAVEVLPQFRVLRRDADRARIEMADAHHHAPFDHERGGGEAEFLGAHQCGDDDVAAGLHLAVDLHRDAVAQAVHQQHLLRLGEPELPRHAAVLDRGERRGAGAAVMPRDEDDVGVRLRDAGRHRADPGQRHELHVDAGLWVRVLQVEDQLREIFDRVDVVVRRRRDQPDARSRVANLRNPRVDLVAGQLAALAGLRALRHLDLDVVGVDQVLARHAKAARGHLLDGAAARIAVGVRDIARRVLAAFAGIRLGADPVHGDGERLVRFLADRPERHRAGREARDDRLDRLDLVERQRLRRVLELEQAAQRREALALVVHRFRVVLEDAVLPAARRVLQLEHRVRIEQVILAVAPPLVLAAPFEVGLGDRPRRERLQVTPPHFLGYDRDANAADARGRAREVLVDERLLDPHRLEQLCAAVALDRRDTHLGHHLEDALVERADVVLHRLLVRDADEDPLADHVVERLERQVRIHRPGAVAEEQRAVVHFTCVARLDDERAARAAALADQVMVHASGSQQARDRRTDAVGVTVRQDQDGVARFHRVVGAALQIFHRALEARTVLRRVEQHRQADGAEARVVDVPQLRQLGVVDHRVLDADLPARLRLRIEQVPLGADRRLHRGDEFLADRVERRVGDLRKQLREVVVEQARLVRQRGQRRVGTHRAERFFAVGRHRRHQDAQFLVGVAEELLTLRHRLVRGRRQVGRRIEIVDVDEVLQPVLVGVGCRQFHLHFLVRHDAAALRVHEEDAARVQPLLDDDVLGREGEHADFRRHHDEIVLRDVVPRGAQAVAVEHGADHRAVGEGNRRGAIPRLHQRRVVLVERLQLLIHRLVVLPRLWDHHEDRVWQRPPRHVEELEDVVEGGGVAAALADDRQQFLQVVAVDARLEQALAGAHPVDVAGEGVDLAVVCDETERVGERPVRERVRAEALVHQRQRRREVGIGQVGEHRTELVRVQHPLVHDGVRRQAGDVEQLLVVGGDAGETVDGVLDALADDVQLPLEPFMRGVGSAFARRRSARARLRRGNEDLFEGRLDGDGARTDQTVVGRHVAPANQALALFGDDPGEDVLDGGFRGSGVRQEDDADAVLTLSGERGRCHFAQERIRELHHDARAVAGVHFAPAGAAVCKVDQDLEALLHDRVRLPTLHIHEEAHAAGVVLVSRIV